MDRLDSSLMQVIMSVMKHFMPVSILLGNGIDSQQPDLS